jgi:hypothetical protein
MQDQSLRRKLGREVRDDVAVDLDNVQRAYALQQRNRQRPQPWANLYRAIVDSRIDRFDDPVDVRAIDQKILSKATARSM